MKDYIYIGSTPCEEDCAQVGSDNYRIQSANELKAFQNQILRVYPIPENIVKYCHLGIVEGEVVCYFETKLKGSLDYALKLEGASKLQYWDERALSELGIAEVQPTKLIKGEYVFVGVFPNCDICTQEGKENKARYDAKLSIGSWANVCEGHFAIYKCSLGIGKGQQLLLQSDKCAEESL